MLCAALAAVPQVRLAMCEVTWQVSDFLQREPAFICTQSFFRRIHIYYCTDEDATAAVGALHQLVRLTCLTLGINCDEGSEVDYDFPGGSDNWEHCVQLEPLAGLTALTELCLVELVELPPNFRQLSNLQPLSVTQGHSSGHDPFNWGSQPLTGLTALTRVGIVQGYYGTELPGEIRSIPQNADNNCDTAAGWPCRKPDSQLKSGNLPCIADPAVLASAPRLVEVHAPEAWSSQVAQVAHWRSQLAALRPDVRITPTLLPAPPAGEGQ